MIIVGLIILSINKSGRGKKYSRSQECWYMDLTKKIVNNSCISYYVQYVFIIAWDLNLNIGIFLTVKYWSLSNNIVFFMFWTMGSNNQNNNHSGACTTNMTIKVICYMSNTRNDIQQSQQRRYIWYTVQQPMQQTQQLSDTVQYD